VSARDAAARDGFLLDEYEAGRVLEMPATMLRTLVESGALPCRWTRTGARFRLGDLLEYLRRPTTPGDDGQAPLW